MTRLRHKGVCLSLAVSLALVSLTGCGAQMAPLSSADGNGQGRTSAVTRSGVDLAASFAEQMKQGGAKVRLAGAVVTLDTQDGEVVTYDFSQTPKTGKVVFRAGEIVTTLDHDEVQAKMIPLRVVYVAVKMIYGGAKAWYWYTRTHEGASFNKDELVKAILYGVIKEGLGGLPFGFLWSRLTPYVWKWVTGEAPIKPTLRELFELMKKDLFGISSILVEAETLKQAK